MKHDRVYNFSAGPCALPVEILEQARDELVNHHGAGMSVMEMSHRSAEYDKIIVEAEADLRSVLSIPDTHSVLFLQGGATMQFAAIPLNLLGGDNKKCDYIVTGQWSEKAHKEALKYGDAKKVIDTKPGKFTTIPYDETEKPATFRSDAKYVHYCANETVNGVEFFSQKAPVVPEGVLLVGDFSSNFMSKPIDFSKHAVVYAGAQKNLGPAGVCVVICRRDILGDFEMNICPTYLSWKTFSDAKSMYNTPACYSIYMIGLNLKYTLKNGGLSYWDDLAEKKSKMLYSAIDESNGFYSGPVSKECRSRMNVPFIIKGGDADLEKKFLAEAKKVGLTTLAGHRSVGGIRASLYNGLPLEGVEALVKFMREFQAGN